MTIFRRDKIKPENRVEVTGLHSQDAFVRALKMAGYRERREPNGERWLVRHLWVVK